MGRKINHCGKNIPVEASYAASNYPNHGDITYFDFTKCLTCGFTVHDFRHHYFRALKPTDTFQSDKHDRHKFDYLINSGQAFLVDDGQDYSSKNTRAQVLASEWTLKTVKPADYTAFYISQNDRAPWVSNKSVLHIKQQREVWIHQYSKGKAKRGLA